MNCQETQSNVLNYINHHLNLEETKDFIEHVRECPSCQDELEINYIMLVGMQQLDNDEILTADFRKELKEDMDNRYKKIKKEADIGRSLKIFAIFFFLSLFLWFLGKFVISI